MESTIKNNDTVQGTGCPVPAAFGSEQAGFQSSRSSDRSDVVIQRLVTTPYTATSNNSGSISTADRSTNSVTETNNPFLKRGTVQRSPIKSFAACTVERSSSTTMLNTEPKVVDDPMNKPLEKHSSDKSLKDCTKRNVHMTQTGIDRYITVKRKRDSPKSEKQLKSKKSNVQKFEIPLNNRFETFIEKDAEESQTEKTENANTQEQANHKYKPPPIYLRETNTHKVVQELKLSVLMNGKTFHVTNLLRGKIHEVKIQTHEVNDYRAVINYFDAQNRNYYTYRLKSSKGLSVVIKGIDVHVETKEIEAALVEDGFKIQNVYRIMNRLKQPQPMVKVELEPSESFVKKGEVHPIYKLKYLIHRRVTVEEPKKRTGPIQCLNCQEYGHSRTYCKLISVCVVCGELHQTKSCPKPKNSSTEKKCSNCGGNHTANYRGCPVYRNINQLSRPRRQYKTTQDEQNNIPPHTPNDPRSPRIPTIKPTYASVLQGETSNDEPTMKNCMQLMMQLMTTMQNMLQAMLQNQTIIIQKLECLR